MHTLTESAEQLAPVALFPYIFWNHIVWSQCICKSFEGNKTSRLNFSEEWILCVLPKAFWPLQPLLHTQSCFSLAPAPRIRLKSSQDVEHTNFTFTPCFRLHAVIIQFWEISFVFIYFTACVYMFVWNKTQSVCEFLQVEAFYVFILKERFKAVFLFIFAF